MSEEEALIPIEEKEVEFYGDCIIAAIVELKGEQQILIPIRPICENLGLSWAGQRERINRETILAEAIRGVRVTRTPGAGGGSQEMLCLPIDMITGWLFGVNEKRVKVELQDKILRYKRECFKVLWDAFKGDILPAISPSMNPPSQLSGAAYALETAKAIQAMAQEQVNMEIKFNSMSERQDTMADFMRKFIKDTRQRLTDIEMKLEGPQLVSEAQAAEIFLAVRNIGKKAETAKEKKEAYNMVYSEIYRRYGLSSYKNLPAEKFEECMAWLHEMYKELDQPGQ